MPIALFARPPSPGRCKTRLAAALGAERAAALYEAFVTDTVAKVRAVPALAPELHVSEDADHPFFRALCARFDLPRPVVQPSAGLGARMAHALGSGRRALLIGTDAPALSPALLGHALRSLESHDVVLTPAADGGFPLVGTAGRPAFLAAPELRWSSAHALADTMRAARAHGLSVALTPPAYDVDEPGDLALLATHLALDPSLAPRTAEALRGE